MPVSADDTPAETTDSATIEAGLGDDVTSSGTNTGTKETEDESISLEGLSVKEQQDMRAGAEKFEFQAEVNRLLDIIIHSLYSQREVFLRELISNASDALDKVRFQSITDPSVLGEGDTAKLEIKVTVDKAAKTLRITDRGVGMTKDDLIKNLGTIAKSGTSKFLETIGKGDTADMSLIGQFGVGFYSVYLVADTVTVTSKNNNDDQYIWESTADASFSIMKDPRGPTLGRGTEIAIKLKEDADEFLDVDKIEGLVKKYSQFINFPIYLYKTKTVSEEVPVEEEEKPAEDAEKKEGEDEEKPAEDEEKKEDEVDVSDDEEDKKEEDKPKTKTVQKEVSEWEHVNEKQAIWTRNPKEIEEEEYNSFYKAISEDTSEPQTKVHFSAEGEIEFKSIVFIPSVRPSDHFDQYYAANSAAIKLYVRRVFITDKFEDLMPKYLNFVRGVIDSDDLPLNISRETLQQHKVIKVMKKKLVRKTLEMIKQLQSDDDKYDKFWENFGKNIKMGLVEDSSNRTKLIKLLRFPSSKSGEKTTTLAGYVKRMKDNQKYIYYISGESKDAVAKSPMVEKLLKRDLEVLYLVDPLDEYCVQQMTEFEDKKLMSVTKEGLKLPGDDDEKAKETQKAFDEEYKDLKDYLKKTLGDKIEKVAVSTRLSKAPSALVTSTWGWTANMERIMKAQAFGDNSQASFMKAQKTLEINPKHPIVEEMLKKCKETPDDAKLADLSHLLFESSMLTSGFQLEDNAQFVSRIHRFMKIGLNLAEDSEAPDEEIPVEEEKKEEGEEGEEG